MLPPNISGARQTSSGAGLKNFRPRGLLAGFFRRTQAHTPEPRPFGIPVGTDEATSAVQRIDNTGGAAGGFRVKWLNAAGVHRPPALRHLRFTLVHQNFPLTVVITHGRFSIWGWTDDPEVNQTLARVLTQLGVRGARLGWQ